MTSLSIDKDVPAPVTSRLYPFGNLAIGDSVAIPFDTINNQRSIKAAAHQWAKRHGCTFATRTIDKKIRVWRLT